MKIIHSVLFNLKHAKGSAEEEKFLADSLSILSAISQVRDFKVYNQVNPTNHFSYALSMVFHSQEDYDAYDQNENHVNFVQNRWMNEVTDHLQVDYTEHF